MNRIQDWLTRWRLKRIILALQYATEFGLKQEVGNFANALEATAMMARGTKRDQQVTIICTRTELDVFISYMTRLHTSKLSLLHRARIGLATLAVTASHALGEDPDEFVKRERPQAKSSSDDHKIIQLNK
jgi:hypothetical protein